MPDEKDNGRPLEDEIDDEIDDEIEIEFVDVEEAEPRLRSAPVEQPEASAKATDEVARLKAEVEHLREMYLRKLAEFDNFRKRTDRERQELKRTAAEGLVSELLPVLDNFERAVRHAEESEPAAFREGVAMIARQFADLLERAGLEAIDPSGGQFNPEQHEAVQRIEGSEYAPGTVVSVFSKGYTFGGRLLRPAMVAVAVEPISPVGEGGPPDLGDEAQGSGS